MHGSNVHTSTALLPDFYEYCTCDLREYSRHKHIQRTWFLPWCHAKHFNIRSNSIFFYCFSCNTHSFCSLFLSLFLFSFSLSLHLTSSITRANIWIIFGLSLLSVAFSIRIRSIASEFYCNIKRSDLLQVEPQSNDRYCTRHKLQSCRSMTINFFFCPFRTNTFVFFLWYCINIILCISQLDCSFLCAV